MWAYEIRWKGVDGELYKSKNRFYNLAVGGCEEDEEGGEYLVVHMCGNRIWKIGTLINS